MFLSEAPLHPLTRARVKAESHIAVFERADDSWKEETVTELVLAGAWPEVRWKAFTRREEVRSGADWLWWWVDASGACFGMLVQAKRLKRTPAGSPRIDFGYNSGKQHRSLMRTARRLGVPAVYALYLGTPSTGRSQYCPEAPHPKAGQRCDRCHRATVSLYAAGLTQMSGRTPLKRAEHALARSYPLEDAATVQQLIKTPWLRSVAQSSQGDASVDTAAAVYKRLSNHVDAAISELSHLSVQAPPTIVETPDPRVAAPTEGDNGLQWLDGIERWLPETFGDEAPPHFEDGSWLDGIHAGFRDALPPEIEKAFRVGGEYDPFYPEDIAGVVVVRLSSS